jgi:hypothetical protein
VYVSLCLKIQNKLTSHYKHYFIIIINTNIILGRSSIRTITRQIRELYTLSLTIALRQVPPDRFVTVPNDIWRILDIFRKRTVFFEGSFSILESI